MQDKSSETSDKPKLLSEHALASSEPQHAPISKTQRRITPLVVAGIIGLGLLSGFGGAALQNTLDDSASSPTVLNTSKEDGNTS